MLSFGLVYYDGEIDFKNALESLLVQNTNNQEDNKFEILIRDQSDDFFASRFIEQKYKTQFENGLIRVWKGENLMHSGGHNFLIDKMFGRHYICASIDMIYHKNCIQNLYDTINVYPEIECFSPIIAQQAKHQSQEKEKNTDIIIDSIGIEKKWYFRFTERGYNTNIHQPKNTHTPKVIFGGSGAFLVLSNTLINKLIKLDGFVFNPELHYKNDVDLSCRLFLYNYRVLFVPWICGYHKRNASQNSVKSKFIIESSIKGQKYLYETYKYTKILPWYFVPFGFVFTLISGLRR